MFYFLLWVIHRRPDAGESPKRKNTTFRTQQEFEFKNGLCFFPFHLMLLSPFALDDLKIYVCMLFKS